MEIPAPLSREEFEALTPQERAYEMAQDVVQRFHLGELTAANNYYIKDVPVKWFPNGETPDRETPLHELVPFMVEHCNPCMLGNMFLSYARRFNTLKFWDFVSRKRDDSGERIQFTEQNRFEKVLLSVFSEEQLELIEAAFEGQSFIFRGCVLARHDSPEYRRYRDAVDFGRPYRARPIVCAYMIAKNIVYNDGLFDPSSDEGEDHAEVDSVES